MKEIRKEAVDVEAKVVEEELEGVKMKVVKKPLQERWLEWSEEHPKLAKGIRVTRDVIGIAALVACAFIAGEHWEARKDDDGYDPEDISSVTVNDDESVTTTYKDGSTVTEF